MQEKKRFLKVSFLWFSNSVFKNFKCWLGHFLSSISPMHFAQSQAGAWYTINILRTTNQLQLCVGTHTGHTHTPPLPAPPLWKAGLPGAAVILGLLSSLFPGACFIRSPCPGWQDALVLGPRFKLSSSHWPGPLLDILCPASSRRSMSLDKEPKPWPPLPDPKTCHQSCTWTVLT